MGAAERERRPSGRRLGGPRARGMVGRVREGTTYVRWLTPLWVLISGQGVRARVASGRRPPGRRLDGLPAGGRAWLRSGGRLRRTRPRWRSRTVRCGRRATRPALGAGEGGGLGGSEGVWVGKGKREGRGGGEGGRMAGRGTEGGSGKEVKTLRDILLHHYSAVLPYTFLFFPHSRCVRARLRVGRCHVMLCHEFFYNDWLGRYSRNETL